MATGGFFEVKAEVHRHVGGVLHVFCPPDIPGPAVVSAEKVIPFAAGAAFCRQLILYHQPVILPTQHVSDAPAHICMTVRA